MIGTNAVADLPFHVIRLHQRFKVPLYFRRSRRFPWSMLREEYGFILPLAIVASFVGIVALVPVAALIATSSRGGSDRPGDRSSKSSAGRGKRYFPQNR